MSTMIRVWQIGRLGYGKSLKLQKTLVNRLRNAGSECENTLILLEHNPVYTIGIRSKEYTAEEERRLKSLGAEFHRTDRGGLITFHGPGQLVVYPILNLRQLHDKTGPIRIRLYVEKLQAAVISTCRLLGLGGCKTLHGYPGVWVGEPGKERKIGAVGVRIGQAIVSHGISLNCNVDLSWFEEVVPCGIQGKGVTSLSKELDTPVSVEDTCPAFLSAFSEEFDCELCDFPIPLERLLFSSLD